MGNPRGMIEAGRDLGIPSDAILQWHLRYNHFPAVPPYMLPVAKEAIRRAREGRWEEEIPLPTRVVHADHGATVPVEILVEELHLEAFIFDEEE